MKDWILTIGIDKYYLSEKQALFYKHAVNQGVKAIEVEPGKILGPNMQSLVHKSVIEETKALSEGKWQCPKGKWHVKNVQCFCEAKYKQLPNGSMAIDKGGEK
jgi:hypothetical protein